MRKFKIHQFKLLQVSKTKTHSQTTSRKIFSHILCITQLTNILVEKSPLHVNLSSFLPASWWKCWTFSIECTCCNLFHKYFAVSTCLHLHKIQVFLLSTLTYSFILYDRLVAGVALKCFNFFKGGKRQAV